MSQRKDDAAEPSPATRDERAARTRSVRVRVRAGERAVRRLTSGAELWLGSTSPGRHAVVFERSGPSVLLLEAGDARLRLGCVKRALAPGDVCVVAPGEVALVEALREGTVRYRVFVDLAEPWAELAFVTRDMRLRCALRDLDEGSAGAVARVVAAARRAARWQGPWSARSGLVQRGIRRIEASLVQSDSTEALARTVGVSKHHFAHRFTAEVGVPPHAYRTFCRVSAARELLRQDELLADAAARCGFTDQSHLSQWFVRVNGVTPGRYAALWRAELPSRG